MFFKFTLAKKAAQQLLKHPDTLKVIVEWDYSQRLYVVHRITQYDRYTGSHSIRWSSSKPHAQ